MLTSCFRTLAPALVLIFPPCSLAGQELQEISRPAAGAVEESVYRELSAAHDRVDEMARSEDPAPRARAFGALGELYAAYELWDAAAAGLTNARTLADRELRWAYLLGYVESQRGNLDAAIAGFEWALKLDPDHLPTLLRLGEAELGRGNARAAGRAFEAALTLDAESAAAHFGLGRARATTGHSAAAVTSFERALELDPAASRIHYPLAQAYRREGRVEDARRHLGQRGDLRPGFVDPLVDGIAGKAGGAAAHSFRGDQAMLAGQIGEAIAAYSLAVAAEPKNFYYRKALGMAIYRQDPRRFEAALQHLVQAMDLDPGEGHRKAEKAHLHYVLGSIAKNQGQMSVAWTHYRAAYGYDEDHVDTNFQIGNMHGVQGRLADALGHYEKALAGAPERSDIRFRYAAVLIDLKRFDEASAALRRVLAAHPGHQEARSLLNKATELRGSHGAQNRE